MAAVGAGDPTGPISFDVGPVTWLKPDARGRGSFARRGWWVSRAPCLGTPGTAPPGEGAELALTFDWCLQSCWEPGYCPRGDLLPRIRGWSSHLIRSDSPASHYHLVSFRREEVRKPPRLLAFPLLGLIEQLGPLTQRQPGSKADMDPPGTPTRRLTFQPGDLSKALFGSSSTKLFSLFANLLIALSFQRVL